MPTKRFQHIQFSSQRNSTSSILSYIFIAYFFSVFARLSLLPMIMDEPTFWYGNHIIPIWTADAGLIGDFAKQILSGVSLPYDNVHNPGHLIAFLSTLSGLHVDIVMFYAPALLASLIVIPIILMMSVLRLPLIGFFAALFASIAFNYYFRTHLGYTDTDILIFVFIYMILYAMIAGIETQKIRYSFIGFLSIIALASWYHSYKPLILGLLLGYFIYILIFQRNKSLHYFSFLLFSIAFIPISLELKLGLGLSVTLLWLLIKKYRPAYLDYRIILAVTLIGISALTTIATLNSNYYHRIIDYFQKKEIYTFTDISGINYQVNASLKGISEAMGLPFMEMITYMSGSIFLFALAIIGLIVLAKERRSSLLLWIMLFLGLSSLLTGVRFTTFAIPAIAIGIFTSLLVAFEFFIKNYSKKIVLTIGVLALIGIFYLPVSSILAYNQILRPSYLSDQAKILDNLAREAKPDDFILSWWDNGWPLWYATGMRTLIDNGKHSIDNFLAAKILLSPNPLLSANLSRYFLEAYAKDYTRKSILKRVAKKHEINSLIASLSQHNLLNKESIDIYYYFNDSLIDRIPIIASFFNIDGKNAFKNEIFSYTFLEKPFHMNDTLIKAKGFVMSRRNGLIKTSDGQQGKVGKLIVSDGISMKAQQFYSGVDYNLIIYKNRYVLMLSDKYLNSFIIRSLLLNQFDPQLFELVSYSKNAKILKLK